MMGGHLWLCALEDDDPFVGVTGYMLLRHTGGGPPNVPGMGMCFVPFSQCSGARARRFIGGAAWGALA